MNFKKLCILGSLIIANIIFAQSDLVKIKLESNNLKVAAGSQFKVVLEASIEETWHVNSNKPNDDFLIPSKVTAKSEHAVLVSVVYPKATDLNLEFSDKPVSVYGDVIKMELTFSVNKNIPAGKYLIPVKFNYQACNDKTCMPPTNVAANLAIEVTGAEMKAESGKPAIASEKQVTNVDSPRVNGSTIAAIDEKEGVKSGTKLPDGGQVQEVKDQGSIASTLEKSGLFLSLIFVFIGGLALNLTPCVYPLIPITIGYFGGQSEGRTSRLFFLGILYVLGMALTYSVIGVVTSLSGAIFGTLMQNMYVIIGIALLFVVLALSQFGVYEFKLPDSWVMKAGGAKGGAFGAFFMGLTMGIVAAPCIGPFVIGLVTYVAAKGDPLYGFLMFFFLALGLGFPYLLLALFSGKIKKLPRAGDWMEGVKHIFGFLLLGMAIYFVGPLLPKEINVYLLPVFGILASFYLLFIDKMANNVRTFRIVKFIFSILVVAVSVYALIPANSMEPDWQKFSEVKYEQSLKNNERMVVDFYADWCIPCKELDAFTFSDQRVLDKMTTFTAYKVDMTQTLSDETENLRNKFSIIGMPTVLIINARGEEVERLTGFVNAAEFLKLLQKAD
ncbi:MAG: thiol:disulfide interchange protein [Ignavibacteriae bacterium HGW-Ignavibacteriae-3]|nr:MAG: thiol:disulfide interchange protein [Ignavibacteriae bacterium HGW-Ignavibacteriae-3]